MQYACGGMPRGTATKGQRLLSSSTVCSITPAITSHEHKLLYFFWSSGKSLL